MSDLIKHNFAPEKVGVCEVTISYCQDGDSCDSDFQQLTVKTQDGGGGAYFVIETKRWAFDDVDALIDVLNDFKKRINL